MKFNLVKKYRIHLFTFLILLSYNLKILADERASRPIYLNLSVFPSARIYNDSGIQITDCQASYCVESLKAGAKIRYLDQGNKFIYSQFTEERGYTKMYKISYEYKNSRGEKTTGTGWVESDFITSQNRVLTNSTNKTEPCNIRESGPSFRGLAEIYRRIQRESANEIIERINNDSKLLISAGVGTCIATQNQIKTNLHRKWLNQAFIYDSVVLPVMSQKKAPNILDQDGNRITNQQLREIDALARTIYSEVAGCFKEGHHYPMFVAAVAKNRVDYYNNVDPTSEFISGNHHPSKGLYAKVLSTSEQFSPWNKPPTPDKIKRSEDYKALRTLLCPPVSSDKPFYTGAKPGPKELEYFGTAVKMAMEAILYPKLFSARAHEVWHYFFTSGKNTFKNMRRVYPSIHGLKIENGKCIEVWNGLPGGHFPDDNITGKPSQQYEQFLKHRKRIVSNYK